MYNIGRLPALSMRTKREKKIRKRAHTRQPILAVPVRHAYNIITNASYSCADGGDGENIVAPDDGTAAAAARLAN